MIKENLKFADSCIFEGMTSISALINSIKEKNNPRKIIKILFDENKLKQKQKELSFLNYAAKELDFEIDVVPRDVIDSYTIGTSHGGIIAFCSDRSLPPLSEDKIKPLGAYYMLEGIEDPYNFGNAIRSLYALGADGIIVGERNWMSAAGVVARASAGSSELIDMMVCDPTSAVSIFKSKGYRVVCAGIRDSVSILDAELSSPVFVILGGEKRGISRAILDSADSIVRIDYGNDFNGSLSASASTSIFAFEIQKNNKKIGY